MMRALACSIAWILAGAALTGAMFWAFLNTPESTLFTLALSLALIVLVVSVLAVTVSGALVGWSTSWRTLRRDALLRGVLAFVPALLVVAAAWFALGGAMTWVTARSGEISAWFLAALDWQDVTPMIRGAVLAGEWLRTIVMPFLALTWLGKAIGGSMRQAAPYAWLPHVPAWLRVLLVTVVAALVLWAPITYGLYWLPRPLPPTWVQPAVAVLKLTAIAIIGAVGFSLIARLAVREAPASAPTADC